ncbi:MAG: PHP domain-containing protein [Phycisphaerales bacterium]
MSINAAVAARLGQIAQLLELTGADKFRVLANQKASRVIEALPDDLARLAKDRAALLQVDGIGPKIADKIIEFAGTGRIAELDDLRAQVPPGLPELMTIPGLGPKTVRMVWQDAGVVDLAGLKRIIADGTILTLPRMGEKAVEKLKASIQIMAEANLRLPLGVALPIAEQIAGAMRKAKGSSEAAFAGSLRRGRDTVGDIDILVATTNPAAAAEAFCSQPGITQVISKGESKCSVRVRVEPLPGDFADTSDTDRAAPVANEAAAAAATDTARSVQVDLRIIPAASWGAAMMYFTGSKEHNVRLRQRALDQGLTLNEFGLFPDDKADTPPQQRGIKPVAAKTEAEVFKALGVPLVPPELREDRGELLLKSMPRLVEVADICAELHAHTTASDGSMSIAQLAAAAKARNFHTIAVTDHSQSSAIANGLKPARLREHIAAVKAEAAKTKGIAILCGSEVDILADGDLDYTDDLLAELDVVVASPHASLLQEPERATARLLKAIHHPLVHILGHPTGRLILRRRGLEPDMGAIIAAAKACNVALEINAHWLRLDLRDTHVKAAIDAGCLIAINCDVHGPDDFDNLLYGVLTGRRGWLTPEQCINTWPAQRLHAWLAAKRTRPAARPRRGT